ncbi:hypothetical protein CC86DRAFT_402878 [Ophiobolus disseminans]|uniref:Uncharacterized protein n=1 Tax=Ophiobolus disseminans TaxID=1469910 RepID=A0A6A7ACJ9_9PLEO|nr:hypothetical protein CC86DRAFT_402878 [Ophiobolus disseminans]
MSARVVQLHIPGGLTVNNFMTTPSMDGADFAAHVKAAFRCHDFDINGEPLFEVAGCPSTFKDIAHGERIVIGTDEDERVFAEPALEALLFLEDNNLPKALRQYANLYVENEPRKPSQPSSVSSSPTQMSRRQEHEAEEASDDDEDEDLQMVDVEWVIQALYSKAGALYSEWPETKDAKGIKRSGAYRKKGVKTKKKEKEIAAGVVRDERLDEEAVAAAKPGFRVDEI